RDNGQHPRDMRLSGTANGCVSKARGVFAGRSRPRAPRDGQEETRRTRQAQGKVFEASYRARSSRGQTREVVDKLRRLCRLCVQSRSFVLVRLSRLSDRVSEGPLRNSLL